MRKGICPFCSLLSSSDLDNPGPYTPAPLRFQISFPVLSSEENLPPLVTFSSDIFHPLVVPLTTYTFSTALNYSPVRRWEQETVSASDEERLPPGGFSLRHGFSEWFGRQERRRVSGGSTQESDNGEDGGPKHPIPIKKLLEYIKSTFDDEKVLDSIPLESAGNPGAWHAWKTYRKEQSSSDPVDGSSAITDNPSKASVPKQPGEWNWEGVFEKRVRSGIDASLSDQVLFGAKGAGEGDVVCFPASKFIVQN